MTTAEKLGNNQVKINVTVSAEDFEKSIANAYHKTGKRYNIPGFRKGKAPQKMIERMYGSGVFYEEAFDSIYWDAFIEAATQAGVVPVDAPNIDIIHIGNNEDLVFDATVYVKPTVELTQGQYMGIEVEKTEYTVSDEQIDAKIQAEQERLARFVTVEDRAVQNGDSINLDYSGSAGGEIFEGGTAEGQTLVIGSKQFIPGFEEQLIGVKIGEEKDVSVTFPTEYHAEDLAGKEAVFHCKVNEIKMKELPELDDEFAKDISEFDTFEDYKADIRKNLEESAKNKADTDLKNNAVDKIVSNVEIDIPQAMVERQIDRTVDNIKYRMSSQGISFEDYLMYTGSDATKIREEVRDEATKRVKADLILETIIKDEDIKADEKDLEEEIEALAKSVKKSVDETKAMLTEADFEHIKQDLAVMKAIDYVIKHAKLVEPKTKEEKDAEQAAKAEVDKVIKEVEKAIQKEEKTEIKEDLKD